ncbi:MAG: DNA-binding protein HU [Hyphomicrobiales bacterium]|nr:MAG: DNA-binding protein HU [Hyphomicrobiales bacterium]
MNKNELIAEVASRTDLTKEQAGAALEGILDTITDALKNKDDVRLLGFGNFTATRREAKMGRNPQTGAPVEIKAANVPKFKAGKGLKDKLN